MRQLFALIIILCSFSPPLWSQARKKTTFMVVDIENYSPILNAKIQAVNDSSIIGFTDSAGKATLVLSGGRIIVSSIQYNTKLVEFEPDSSGSVIVIELEPLIMLLEQTVISAGRHDQPLKNTSASIERIRPELLDARNSLTIKDGLSQVPGVSITDNQVNIRNGSGWSYGAGSRVMVMVDDMPMLSGDAASPLWTFINTDGIESVEVIKGASSVLFGSSALTGVINIRSENPGNQPKTKVRNFYGLYNTPQNENWQWSDKPLVINGFNALHLRRIGKYALTAGMNGQIDDGYRMGDQDNRMRLNLHLSRRFLKDKAVSGIRYNLLKAESASFLLWQNYDSAYTALDEQITTTSGTRYTLDYYWKYYGKKGLKILAQGRYMNIDNQVNNGNPDNDQSNASQTGYYELRLSRNSTRTSFHAGYLFQGTTSRAPLFEGRHTTTNQAPYAQLEWRPTSRITFELGGRYEVYKLDENVARKPVFRTGLNIQAGTYRFIRASFGQGFRFPTIAESFIKTTVGTVSIYPNSMLRPETGWNAEVGIKQGFKHKKLKLIADLAGFWMEYQDMMEFIFTQWSTNATIENGLGFGFKALNVGNTRITGADLSILFDLKINDKQKLEGMAGYTYTLPVFIKPDNVFASNAFGKDLTFNNTSSDPDENILKYRYKHLVKVGARYTAGRLDIGFNLRFNSYIENMDGAFVEFPINLLVKGIAEAREKDKNGKTFIDAQAGWQINKQFRAGISATNVFRQYQLYRPADLSGPGYVILQVQASF